MANVVTCDALEGLLIDILSRYGNDPELQDKLRRLLNIPKLKSCKDEAWDGDDEVNVAQCSDIPKLGTGDNGSGSGGDGSQNDRDDGLYTDIQPNSDSPTGNSYLIKLVFTDGNGNEYTAETDLDDLVNDINDLIEQKDKYVEGSDVSVEQATDPNTGDTNITSAKITLHVHNGDDVDIDITDLANRLKAIDKYLKDVSTQIVKNPDGSLKKAVLKFTIENGAPIEIDLNDLWQALQEIEQRRVKKYYANLMYNTGKMDSCTNISTERVGWLFHPDAARPSDAKLRIKTADNPPVVLAYGYQSSAYGHDIPVFYHDTDTDRDVVIGYASNSPIVEEIVPL